MIVGFSHFVSISTTSNVQGMLLVYWVLFCAIKRRSDFNFCKEYLNLFERSKFKNFIEKLRIIMWKYIPFILDYKLCNNTQ